MNMTSMAYSRPQLEVRAFVIAWACALVFEFLGYAARSAPAVMIPQLAASFRQTTFGVSSILGSYYYTYSTASLLAGLLLDRLGAKYVVPLPMPLAGTKRYPARGFH
jgi:fucose permease